MSSGIDERAVKLLQLALNPAAHEGEWANAFAKIRKMATNVDQLVDLLAEPEANSDDTPFFPFGKYKGYTVKEIWKCDPGYLQWAFENCKTIPDWLRSSIRRVIS